MANNFKNASMDITTVATALYVCPAATTAVIHTLKISNEHNINAGEAQVLFVDSSAAVTRKIGNKLPIPVGGILTFDKPINLETGDSIELVGDANGVLTAFASILEIS